MSNGGNTDKDTFFTDMRGKLRPGSSQPAANGEETTPESSTEGVALTELEAEVAAAEAEAEAEKAEAAARAEAEAAARALVKLEDEVPVYLLDEEPTGESNMVKWALMHGYSEAEVEAANHNTSTVRICAQELERDKHRKRPLKIKPGGEGDERQLQLHKSAGRGLRVFSGGSPPEALIESINLPLDGHDARTFENGLKAGALLLVLGVRVAQELSAVGIQQAKPIMEMARAMREGEAAAAKSAATEAAQGAALGVVKTLGPQLDSLEGAVSSLKAGEGKEQDPMREMVVRAVEPLFKNIIRMIMPGLQNDQGSGQQQSSWPVTEEK